MVVVFGDEVKMIYEAHRLPQAGMHESLRELGWSQNVQLLYKCGASRPEFIEKILNVARVVIGFVRFAVLEVGGGKLRSAFDKIVNASAPQCFQIQEMAHLLLNGPFSFPASDKEIARAATKHLFEASWSSTQPYTKIGKQVRRKTELEFTLEPLA
jgi:hypothetical protein